MTQEEHSLFFEEKPISSDGYDIAEIFKYSEHGYTDVNESYKATAKHSDEQKIDRQPLSRSFKIELRIINPFKESCAFDKSNCYDALKENHTQLG